MTPEQQKIILLGRARRRRAEAEGSQPSAMGGAPQRPVNEFDPAPAPDVAANNRLIPQTMAGQNAANDQPGPGAPNFTPPRVSEGVMRNDVGMRSKMAEQTAFEDTVPANPGEERAASVMNGFTLGQFPRAMGAGAGLGAAVAYPLTAGKIADGKGFGEYVSGEAEQARKESRLQVNRGREARPLESMGLEIVPGIFTGKTAFDILTQGKKMGGLVRGIGSGATSGASYGLSDRSNDLGTIEQRQIGDTGAVANKEVSGRDVAQTGAIGAVAGGVLGGAIGKTGEVIGNRVRGDVQGNLLGSGKVKVGQLLDMEIGNQPLRPQALNRVVNIIRKDGNLAPENIKGLFEAVQQRLGSMDVGQSERLTIGQALSEALERDYPQAARNIETALLSSRLSTRKNDSSPAIIGRVADDLRGSQSDFLSGSTKATLGDKTSLKLSDELDAARADLGKQYEAIFAPGASVAPEGSTDDVVRAIDYWRNDKGLTKAAEMIARGEGYKSGVPFSDALDHYIKTDPRRTAHWMQSAAAGIVRKEKARPEAEQDAIKIRNYTQIRDNLLGPLEKATPGYKDVRSKFGTVEEIDAASNAGNAFFLKARNEGDLDRYIRDDLGKLSPEARAAALASIRDKIGSFLRGGPEDAPARITQISSTGALDALEKLGPDGAKLADDIRFIRRENQYLGKFVPTGESATAKNLRAMNIGEGLGNTGALNALKPKQEGGGDIAAMIRFGANVGGKAINALAKPRVKTLEDTTRFLMARKGNIPAKPKGADFSPRFKTAGNALAGNDSGMVTPDAASALSTLGGAGVGAASAGDIDGDGKVTWKDRTAGAVIGGSLAYGARRGLGATADVMINSRVASAAVKRASGEAERILKDFPKPRTPGQPMTGDIMDDLLTVRLNQVLAEKGIDPEAFYRGSAKVDAKKFAPMQEAERRVIKDLSEIGYGMPQDQEWLRAIRTFTPEQYNKWQADDVSEMVAKFRRVQGKEMTPEVPAADGPRVLDSPGRAMVKPRPANDTKGPVRGAGLGGVRSDAGNALAGGVVGGAMPADNNQDRARNALIGAVGGGLAGRVGPKTSASSAGVGGKRPPKIKSDIPLGTPAKGKTKLPKSLAEMMVEPVPMQGIAKATGDAKTVMSARSSQATDMLAGGKTLTEIHKKTGLVPLEYKGGRVLIDSGDKGPDEVLAAFYQGAAMPQGKRPEWVQGVIDEIDTLVLDKPLPNTTPAGKGPRDRYAQNPDGTISKRKDDWKNPKGPVRGAGFTGQKLPMDEPARMARAKADGFDTDTVLYHGTRRDFEAFDINRGIDGGFGTHLGTKDQSHDIIRSYGNEKYRLGEEFSPNSNIIPVHIKAKNLLRLKDHKTWSADQILSQLAWLDNPIEIPRAKFSDPFNPKLPEIRKALEEKGYDGIIYQNRYEGSKRGEDSYIIFDPKNIRSKFAKFDPKNRNSSDLLAAAPLVGGAGAVAAKERENRTGNALALPPRNEKTGQFMAEGAR
jgi:hypothetical protein